MWRMGVVSDKRKVEGKREGEGRLVEAHEDGNGRSKQKRSAASEVSAERWDAMKLPPPSVADEIEERPETDCCVL